MHFFKGSKGTIINYNSDLSQILVTVDNRDVETSGDDVKFQFPEGYQVINIDGDDLLEFMAEHIRRRKIAALDDMTPEELVKEFIGAS